MYARIKTWMYVLVFTKGSISVLLYYRYSWDPFLVLFSFLSLFQSIHYYKFSFYFSPLNMFFPTIMLYSIVLQVLNFFDMVLYISYFF